MKRKIKCFCLLLLFFVGSVQIDAQEKNFTTEDYSKMSTTELDTAFVVAVRGHRSKKVEELIQAGANVNTPIPYVWTAGDCDWNIESSALIYAIRHNCPGMVRALIKVEENCNEALETAILTSSSDVVEEIIKEGADINYVNKNGNNPLIIAIQRGNRKIIQALIKEGANVNHVNEYSGKTALMLAVEKHALSTVLTLLEIPEMTTGSLFGFGTKPINYADNDGNTALILAIKSIRYTYFDKRGHNICVNSQKILETLLETPGIDLYHINKNGETAVTLLEELNKKMDGYPY